MIRLRPLLEKVLGEIGDRVTTDNIVNSNIGYDNGHVIFKLEDEEFRVVYTYESNSELTTNQYPDFFGEDFKEKIDIGEFNWYDDPGDYNSKNWGTIFVKFDLDKKFTDWGYTGDYNVTDRGDVLNVISNVMGSIRHIIEKHSSNILGISYVPKTEFSGDKRRERLYDNFLKKMLKSMSPTADIQRLTASNMVIYMSSKPLKG